MLFKTENLVFMKPMLQSGTVYNYSKYFLCIKGKSQCIRTCYRVTADIMDWNSVILSSLAIVYGKPKWTKFDIKTKSLILNTPS